MNNLTKFERTSAKDPLTKATIRIGVMGSAVDEMQIGIRRRCHQLGRAIAKSGCCLLTGACPGLPHEAVLGAKTAGGHIIGISPAVHLKEHVEKFVSPYIEYDVLIFTGLGLMGRELINIRSSDIIIIVGGRCGTLGEFSIAYEEGKLIGVLVGTGGITPILAKIVQNLDKQTGAEVLYDTNPTKLVKRLLKRYHSPSYCCPCHPAHKNCGCASREGS